ncbi:MAG: hypothetical protein IPI67_35205 [Myxococcales bacterium]|nr:hypothetical protein [Myxococcales bacterium]
MRERVNSPSDPGQSRRWLAFALLFSVWTGWARAETKREAPLLFGGGAVQKKAPVQTDPWLPTGATVRSPVSRPADVESPGCSFRYPVCVHRSANTSPERALRALSALENAYGRLVEVLRLPRPLSDAGMGGSDHLDLYLTSDTSRLRIGVEPQVTRLFDQAAGFCLVGDAEHRLLEREAALCVGEAIGLGLDPAETPHLRRAYASHLWSLIAAPTSADMEAIDEVQAHPERAIASRELNESSEGAGLWFEYLEASRGTGYPGTLATNLMSIAASKTEPRGLLWNNSPDVFDVLRRALDDKPRDAAMLLSGFAVTRGFLGARDDGEHLPQLEWSGDFGRVRYDWSIKLSSLPRRVASLRPIEPTGAMYVWLEVDRPLGDKELAFQAEWESPVSFQWAIVRVDAEGRELSRIYAPFVERGTQVQQTLTDLDGAHGVLIVGTNLGGVSLSHPFDPDYSPFEPHGCTVYLTQI